MSANKTTTREGTGLNEEIAVTLTQRDIFLLRLCLHVVDRDRVRGENLKADIHRLLEKLASESGQK